LQPEDTEWDEFGNDLYAIPEVQPSLSCKLIRDASPPRKVDKDSKIKALVDTPALNWQRWHVVLLLFLRLSV